MEQGQRGGNSHDRVWQTIGVAFAVPVVAAVIAFVMSSAVTAVVAVTMFEDSSSEGADEGDALTGLAIWFSVVVAVFLVAAPIVGALFTRGSAPRRHRITLTALYGGWAPTAVAVGGLAAWFGHLSVTAKRPTGYWSADPGSRCAGPVVPGSEQLRDLLGTVRPVTVEAWVDAT